MDFSTNLIGGSLRSPYHVGIMPTQLPGFKYLFQTTQSDTCTIYIPNEGVMGMFGSKREVIVKKREAMLMERTLLLETPSWFVESGVAQQIMSELETWSWQ